MPSFNLTAGIDSPEKNAPAPAEVKINLRMHKTVVEKGGRVKTGELLAEAVVEGIGDAHSSVTGEVVEVTEDFIRVKAEGNEEYAQTLKIDSSSQESLRKTLCRFGFDGDRFKPVHSLIINGLNEEPGVYAREQVLRDHADELDNGFQAL